MALSPESPAAPVIRRAFAANVGIAHYFLFLVGEATCRCDWVVWEIASAVELGKKIIVVVKMDITQMAPVGRYGIMASWAQAFTFESIRAALAGTANSETV